MALEGINQVGHLKKRMIILLNDNEMSISPNVGALERISQIESAALDLTTNSSTKSKNG